MQLLKQVRWVSIADPARTESWLSKMAEKGYFIKKYEKSTFFFEHGKPEKMEYRIVYTNGKALYEQLCYYQELGWTIVQGTGNILILEASTKDEVSERYFGEEEKAQWKKKDLLVSFTGLAAGAGFFLWLLKGILSGQSVGTINYRNINRGYYVFVIQIIAILMFLNVACANYRNRRYVHKVEKYKKAAHHKRAYRPISPEWVIGSVGVIASVVLLMYGTWKSPGTTLTREQIKQIPWLQQESLENVGNKKYVDGMAQQLRGAILADTYTYQTYYTEKGQEYKGVYQEYYEKRGSWKQKEFLQSILLHSSKVDGGRSVNSLHIQELSVDGLDVAYYIPVESKGSYVVAAANGTKMLYAEVYDPSIDYDTILSQMKENLRS